MAVKELLWKVLAWIVSCKPVANYLIERAKRTPYFDLEGYMERNWLYNGFDQPGYNPKRPSVRVHHILRKDLGRHKHDHPWDARTIVLRGYYIESRMNRENNLCVNIFMRGRGDTATIDYGEYHEITEVSPGGVWTLFITWKYHGTWGFWVDGKKIPWREYNQ